MWKLEEQKLDANSSYETNELKALTMKVSNLKDELSWKNTYDKTRRPNRNGSSRPVFLLSDLDFSSLNWCVCWWNWRTTPWVTISHITVAVQRTWVARLERAMWSFLFSYNLCACVSVCVCLVCASAQVSKETSGHGVPWSWSWRYRQLWTISIPNCPGTKPRSSSKAVQALNHGTISPASCSLF